MNEKDQNVHNLCISCGQLFLEIFFFMLSKNHLCEVNIFIFHEKKAHSLCQKQYNTL